MFLALASLIALYFLLKNLIKLVLIFLLVMVAIGGYFYVQDPKKATENIGQTIRTVRTYTGKIWDTGKWIYKKGGELATGAANLLQKEKKD